MAEHPSPLPPGYTTRSPVPDDLAAVVALLNAVTIAESGEPDYSEADLRDEWAGLDLATEALIVLGPDDETVAYVTLVERGGHTRLNADGYVHPKHEGRGLGAHLVGWTEDRARRHVPLAPPGTRVVLDNAFNARNDAARRLLGGRGYDPVRYFWRMEIELDGPPPAPVWPAGISVRSVATPDDEVAIYQTLEDAFRDHWGHTPTTFEEWSRRMKGERFEPGLWFLVSEGEEVAGALVGGYAREMGWVRYIGVRAGWRRRGLGLALLRHAFGEFYGRGRRTVGLGVDAENETGAIRLYEGAGMRVAHQYVVYLKELRPGAEGGVETATS